jgi:PKD repeat protein
MARPFPRPAVHFMFVLVIVCAGFVIVSDAQSAQPQEYTEYTIGSTTPPEADFLADPVSGTAPLTVRFFDKSLYNPESWLWDFDGDGRIDDQIENPEYTYREPGTYTVSLIVSNSAGKDEETKKGYITVTEGREAPVADFVADITSGTAPLTVRFSDRSTNNPYYWEWDLDGDGRIDSKEENPVHTYSQPGFFTVRLTVWTNAGEDIEAKPEYITVLPGETAEEPFLPADVNEEKTRDTYVTRVTTEPTPEFSPETKTIEPMENTDELPDLTLLILFIAAAALVTGGLLFRRLRSSRQSSDVHPDLHLELSGGIDFGDVLPPVEDAAEALLPGEDEKKGGGER